MISRFDNSNILVLQKFTLSIFFFLPWIFQKFSRGPSLSQKTSQSLSFWVSTESILDYLPSFLLPEKGSVVNINIPMSVLLRHLHIYFMKATQNWNCSWNMQFYYELQVDASKSLSCELPYMWIISLLVPPLSFSNAS